MLHFPRGASRQVEWLRGSRIAVHSRPRAGLFRNWSFGCSWLVQDAAWRCSRPRPGMRNWRTDFAGLIERGFNVYGVDASPSMVAAFRARFPTAPVECAAAEDSDFFRRTFDGVVACGLFFLLDAEVQRKLIARVAAVLSPGGRLLFTAPNQSCSWPDAMTGRTSISLGHEGYRNALEGEGLSLVGTDRDEGENYYYFARMTGG
jgi:SAM-dependent methyltransferase